MEALRKDVLILLRCVVGDVIEIPCVGHAVACHAVVSVPRICVLPLGCQPTLAARCGQVILVHGQGIGGLQPTECAQVIELVVSAGTSSCFARSVEVAGIALKQQGREAGGSVRSGEADDAACRIGADTGSNSGRDRLPRFRWQWSKAVRSRTDCQDRLHSLRREEFCCRRNRRRGQRERSARRAGRPERHDVPGIRRRALTRSLRNARSSGPSTLVAALVCGCGVGVPVAVTTIDSRTHSGSSTRLRSTLSSWPA